MIKKLENGKFQVVDEDGKSKGIYTTMAGAKKNDTDEGEEKEDEVKMDFEDFCDEHVDLVELLREGTRDELLAEADKQEKELEDELKKRGMTMVDIEKEDSEEED